MGYLWRGVGTLLPHGVAADEGSGQPNFKLMADLTVTMAWYYRGTALLVILGLYQFLIGNEAKQDARRVTSYTTS
jgi:hypothetical protein